MDINVLEADCRRKIDLMAMLIDGSVASDATPFGLRSGIALDLRSVALHSDAVVKSCWATLASTEPWIILTARPRADLGIHDAVRHYKACSAFAIGQVDRGRHFFHEHPRNSWMWRLPCMRAVTELDGVLSHFSPETIWTSSVPEMVAAASINLEPLPNATERYPPFLVERLLRAIRSARAREFDLHGLEAHPDVDDDDIRYALEGNWDEQADQDAEAAPEPDPVVDGRPVYDEYSGLLLPAADVAAARADEMKFMKELTVWTVVPVQRCIDRLGRKPLGTRWIDHNKGLTQKIEIRSRLVVQDTRRENSLRGADTLVSIFSATPPLEGLRFMLSLAMSLPAIDGEALSIRVLDISRAHPHVPIQREVYIRLPVEAGAEPGECGLLSKLLYGCRDAPQGFELFVRDILVGSGGFEQGLSSPCLYAHIGRSVRVLVHGDDFLVLGTRFHTDWTRALLAKFLIVKDRGILGPLASDMKEITILNRLVRWVAGSDYQADTIEYEADPRHVRLLLREASLTSTSKGVATPSVKMKVHILEGAPLTNPRPFRSQCMRVAYLALDRPDIQYPSKEAARCMSAPTVSGAEALKRIIRYLLAYPRLVWVFRRQVMGSVLAGDSDSDWAGCPVTRKSTTGLVLLNGNHCVKTASSTQQILGLSSGESEFYAGVRVASHLLGFRALAEDLGIRGKHVRLGLDSTSAMGAMSRRGAGRIRHIQTPTLWIQQLVSSRQMSLRKIKGTSHTPDMLTKHMTAARIQQFLSQLSMERRPFTETGLTSGYLGDR